jgi:hypothetical protein
MSLSPGDPIVITSALNPPATNPSALSWYQTGAEHGLCAATESGIFLFEHTGKSTWACTLFLSPGEYAARVPFASGEMLVWMINTVIGTKRMNVESVEQFTALEYAVDNRFVETAEGDIITFDLTNGHCSFFDVDSNKFAHGQVPKWRAIATDGRTMVAYDDTRAWELTPLRRAERLHA